MTVIDGSGIRKRIDGQPILRGVDMTVFEGDIYGFLGPNGAGKTTTFNALLGLLELDDGSVRLLGQSPAEDRSVMGRVSVAFEHETLDPNWTVGDNLEHTCAVYEVPPARIDDYLDVVGLDRDVRDKEFGDCSKGMKRKATLADALLPDPDLLVLDEPLSGLDPEAQVAVEDLLVDLRDRGKTIVFSSHNLDEVQALCNRVGIIRNGRTVLETDISDDVFVLRGDHPEFDEHRAGDVYVFDEPPDGHDGEFERVDLERLYFSVLGVSR
ncbi:ABC transporter ATP-binding protein [Halostella litorea]|uniref:ABC transporter ATP-binding protein n=1 Tax=Halostella litorea TaxID=2528831 RepID=UPI0010922382|nr:ABC transporter ATP-binding protein [Halostella litorea]